MCYLNLCDREIESVFSCSRNGLELGKPSTLWSLNKVRHNLFLFKTLLQLDPPLGLSSYYFSLYNKGFRRNFCAPWLAFQFNKLGLMTSAFSLILELFINDDQQCTANCLNSISAFQSLLTLSTYGLWFYWPLFLSWVYIAWASHMPMLHFSVSFIKPPCPCPRPWSSVFTQPTWILLPLIWFHGSPNSVPKPGDALSPKPSSMKSNWRDKMLMRNEFLWNWKGNHWCW